MANHMLQSAAKVGGETALSRLFRHEAAAGKPFDDRLPFDPAVDVLKCDFDILHGRIDLLTFHEDRSFTVIVLKDGALGPDHVAAGLGLAALYAAQFALVRPNANIRKALLWASTGDLLLDAMLEDACAGADVIPLPWGTLKTTLASTRAHSNASCPESMK